MHRIRDAALTLLVSMSAACASGQPAQIGDRVSVPASRAIPPAESAQRGRTVVGELVRQAGDTVWIRVPGSTEPRRFDLSGRWGLRSIQARGPEEPWMGGDSIRVRRPRFGSTEPPTWRVAGRTGDTVYVVGPARHPEDVLAALRRAPATGRSDRARIERRTVRARPGTAILLGTLTTAAGVGLAVASKSRDPIPFGEDEPQDYILPVLAASTIIGGGIIILTAFMPRPGWDEIDPEALPPIRVQPGDSGELLIGVRLPVGSQR